MAKLKHLPVGTVIKCKNKYYHPELIKDSQKYYTLRKEITETNIVIDEETDKREMRTYWKIISEGSCKGCSVNSRDIPDDYKIIAMYDMETINNILQHLMSLSLKQTNEQIQYGIEISIAKIRELGYIR